MRFKLMFSLATLLIAVPLAHAGTKNLAEYPLRVHIFAHNGHGHFWHQSLQYTEGTGRANLFENSKPTAFDFNFHCPARLMNTPAFETYPARWKKPGRQLALLIPELGKSDSWLTCDLDVTLKTGVAYFKHEGNLNEELTATFVQWMQKHDYDPEHGKNDPVRLSPQDIPTPEPQQQDQDYSNQPIAPPTAPTDSSQQSPQPPQNPK